MQAHVVADPDATLAGALPAAEPAHDRATTVPTTAAFAGAVFILLGLWWVLAALSDVLRDLHLAGSIAAVSVTDVLNPLVFPKRAAEMLRVWQDWDASGRVTGQDLRSGVVLTVWLVVDVVFAIALCWFLRGWARSRRRILTEVELYADVVALPAVDPRQELARRVRATIPLLDAAVALASAYLVFEVVENLAFWFAAVPSWRISFWLNVAYVADVGKWLALIVTAVPIAVSYLAARHSESVGLPTGEPPESPLRGYLQTALDLRAQVIAIGFVCAALLFLPGNVRPQLHDIVRNWHHEPGEAVVAVVLVGILSGLTWWTGRRTLERVEATRAVTSGSLEGSEGARRRLAVLCAGIGSVLAAFVADALGGRKVTFFVVAAAFFLWWWCSASAKVRRVTITRPAYARRPGIVRVLTFLPIYALAVVWMRAEIPRMLSKPWPYRIVVLTVVVAGLCALWTVLTQTSAPGTPHTSGSPTPRAEPPVTAGGRRASALRSACQHLRPVDVLLPLLLALGAALLLGWAGTSLWASWFLGAVGMVALGAIVLLGVFGALTAVCFDPPRGLLALIRLKRLPVITSVMLVAFISSAVVKTPGFHKVRVHPSTVAARATEGTRVREQVPLDIALERWRTAAVAQPAKMKWRPLVVLASSGGGGRAAYWTLLTLNCVFGQRPITTSDAPACARNGQDPPSYGSVFAASGISGGSVGLTMFGADRDLDPDAVFADGFVDPVVANLFTRDVPNVLLHAPGWRDRAARLEQSFEDKVPGLRDDFFTDGSTATGEDWDPLLVLNSAAVEDGCRVVVANVSVAAATTTTPPTPFTLSGSCRALVRWRLAVPPPAAAAAQIDAADQPWASTRDLAQIICASQNISKSTAALLSARFPYVSPSGAVEFCRDKDRYTYLVDGGTIDSSAALPASLMLEEIVRRARSWNASRPKDEPCVQPVVLQIDNGYEDVIATGAAARPSELTVPLRSGISGVTNNADTARQQLALLGTQLHERAGCAEAPELPTYLQVYPQSHPGSEAPLGWSLSEDSRTDMKQQLASDPNQCTLLALRYWLTGDAGAGACIEGTVETDAGDGMQAVAGHPVCLADPAHPDAVIELRTNAYGVFVHAGNQTDAPLEPQVEKEECGGITEAKEATYGVDGAFSLGYRLRATASSAAPSARWEWWLIGLGGLVCVTLLIHRGARASRREVAASCRRAVAARPRHGARPWPRSELDELVDGDDEPT